MSTATGSTNDSTRLCEHPSPPSRAPVEGCHPTTISGWGGYPVTSACVRHAENLDAITDGAVLTRGLGRSYGDSSLPPATDQVVAASPLADRLLAFDRDTGLLRAEAGLSLTRLNRVFLPLGWFSPVTPGTHYVTLGGMVAADVHGKNHHQAGCFGEHVTTLKMRVADGRVLECSDHHEQELFRATLGGMGLTGHILEVEFRLRRIPSPWIWQESEQVPDFETLLGRLEQASKTWPFTVTWSDFLVHGRCAGRGLLIKGRWADPSEAPKTLPRSRSAPSLPAIFPSWFLRPWMVSAFNRLYYSKQRGRTLAGIVHPEAFFYPLDVIRQWNRLYGKRGFTQYSCILPSSDGYAEQRRFLQRVQERQAEVFLSVVKDCGAEGKGMISFPKPGILYSLDIPIGARTQDLVDTLNELVIAEGGRVYLAKDAFTRPEHFRAMESRLDIWNAVRRKWDPEGRIRSAQSVRLLGDRP